MRTSEMIFQPMLFGLLCCIVLLASGIHSHSGEFGDEPQEVILSRRRRYVAFPDGSTLIFALCATAQTILPFQVFTEGVNWGIAYNLPNKTSILSFWDQPKAYLKRRHRRDLYNKAEALMDSLGLDGKGCIYRALCEAGRFTAESGTLAEEIIRLLFKFPHQPPPDSEPEEHHLYHQAYREGRTSSEQQDSTCQEVFPTCPISLIDLALGYYQDDNDEPEDHERKKEGALHETLTTADDNVLNG